MPGARCWPARSTGPASTKFFKPGWTRWRRPTASPDAPLRALIFDSWFDPYRGVIILTRVIEGRVQKGMKIRLWATNSVFEVDGLGYQSPKPIPCDELAARGGG